MWGGRKIRSGNYNLMFVYCSPDIPNQRSEAKFTLNEPCLTLFLPW